VRRRRGRRAGTHIVGRPARVVRAYLRSAADVRRGRVGRHTLGPRRLRTAVAG